jgi:hypothetical protein
MKKLISEIRRSLRESGFAGESISVRMDSVFEIMLDSDATQMDNGIDSCFIAIVESLAASE